MASRVLAPHNAMGSSHDQYLNRRRYSGHHAGSGGDNQSINGAVSGASTKKNSDCNNNNHNAAVAECSMCGDLGVQKKLFKCRSCNYRYQHTYCCNWYPKEISAYTGICNWCAAATDNYQQACNDDDINNDDDDDGIAATDNAEHHAAIKSDSATHRQGNISINTNKSKPKRLAVRRYKFVSEV